ncbi:MULTISPECIES: MerR family DNA-binding transcriptional regulator [Streptomyces]|uniref:MerR family DNA-binding transcriptional regulator n=1 Tax=Streptomyces TaxID=1883 RepID=UPI00068A56EC|nr:MULTISPECIES: MerR family DNA-binding transcriptional regulator [Streptomyces]MBL0779724.1 MerR family DNA-binding transcriptional regulator [Streptomyces albidoflavus]MBL0802197.1 MerR family DNA-binding transcriptional regulator [Streptomyces albidoflavus]MBV1953461.1 MerR family DNA-binding transcriptional regulator [Streptomyces sp. BV333]MCG5119784.1 MerR family DNA-binding transcriptional regulator [Streptomyces sp. T7(2022)]MCK2142659.1 MerR family DNA-binding transcriptional regulat
MLKIGEVARRTGVSVRALRYYEEQGLLTPDRTPSGQRRYPEETVEVVLLFQRFYAAGLSSRAIAALLPCVNNGHPSTPQRHLLRTERDRLASRVAEMTDTLHRLDQLITDADRRAGVAA